MSDIKDSLEVIINGNSKSLFMSFGLLTEIISIVGKIDNVPMIMLDSNMKTDVLILVLGDRDEKNKLKSDFNLASVNMTVETTLDILEWVSDHCLDFFMKTAEKLKRMEEKYGPRLKSLTSTTTGQGG